MICLRCGYCCQNMWVFVVHPDYVKPDLNISELPEEGLLFLDGTPNSICPHLKQDLDGCSCSIHHYDWYNQTMCFSHSQFETENSNCRIGEYKRKVN